MQERRDVRTFLDGAETVNEGGRAADIDLDESQRGLRQLLPCMQSSNRNREGGLSPQRKSPRVDEYQTMRPLPSAALIVIRL